MKQRFISYSFLFSLPIIIISLIMLYLIEIPIKQTYLNEQTKSFEQQAEYIDRTLQLIELYVSNWGNIYSNDEIIPYENISEHYLDIQEISTNLFHLENSSPLISSAVIVVQTYNPYFISTGGTWQPSSYAYTLPIEELDNEKTFQYLRIKKNDKQQLLFVQKVSQNNKQESSFLVANIHLNYISNLLEISSSFEGGFSVYLMDDYVLASTKDDIDLTKTLSQIDNNESSFVDLDDLTYSLSRISINRFDHNWSYLSFIPVSQIIQQLSRFSQLLLLISLALVIVTFAVNYYYSLNCNKYCDNFLFTQLIRVRVKILPRVFGNLSIS